MSIPLSALGVSDDARRDGYGRYLILPPGGRHPVGHTRVTTIAKILDSGGGLAPWKATMTAVGIMLRKGLRARWEALIAEYDGDPWYASQRGKAATKKLVEECAAVGGANDRAEMGTALHTITALVDLGRTPTNLTEETERDITAYVDGLIAAGVTIEPGMVEVMVVLDEYRVAGTFDRLVRIVGFDLPLIADLKTGADLSYSWQSIAVQLAAYAHADSIYVQGAADDGSEDERTPMPAVDQRQGLIMWLDAGSGRLELFLVDLVAGWEAFKRSVWTKGWRKEKVAYPLAECLPEPAPRTPTDDADLVELLAASIEQSKTTHPSNHKRVLPDPPATPPPTTEEVRDWLQERIDVIGVYQDARVDLVQSWPHNTPTLKGSLDHTAEQLAQIEAVLNGVEARHSIPFGTLKPGAAPDPIGRVLQMFPNSTIHEENPA